jgi:chloramphenicol 3-O-phosphotransferase
VTRLVVLRGNSASGKSSVAAGLRDRFGRGLAIVGLSERLGDSMALDLG